MFKFSVRFWSRLYCTSPNSPNPALPTLPPSPPSSPSFEFIPVPFPLKTGTHTPTWDFGGEYWGVYWGTCKAGPLGDTGIRKGLSLSSDNAHLKPQPYSILKLVVQAERLERLRQEPFTTPLISPLTVRLISTSPHVQSDTVQYCLSPTVRVYLAGGTST